MKRTGPARVIAVAAKQRPPAHTAATVGGAVPMTDRAADALAELIEIGRAVDAEQRRERRSKP